MDDVTNLRTASTCPVIISDTSGQKRVYNMSAFAGVHVHGANDIFDYCGLDMTEVFQAAPHKFVPFQGETGTVEQFNRADVFTCLGTVAAGTTFRPTPAPGPPPSPATPYPCLTAGYTYIIKQAILAKFNSLPDHAAKSAFNGGLTRLAFHDSTTYLKTSNEGGPDGCLNLDDPDNAGLAHHVEMMEVLWQPFKNRISRADFWYLAAVTVVEHAGGPSIPFRYGRKDCTNETFARNNDKHRLPDAQRDWHYVQGFFGWACGFSDREITALMGAHVLGRTHANNSGFDGPWVTGTNAGLKFDNQFYLGLMTVEWIKEPNNFTNFPGRYQWNQGGVGSGLQMFLTSDVALLITNPNDPRCTSSLLDTTTLSAAEAVPKDPDCLKNNVTFLIVDEYARSQAIFFRDFSIAFQKLCELGYPNGTLIPPGTCFPGAETFNDPPVPGVSGVGPVVSVSFFVVFVLSVLV